MCCCFCNKGRHRSRLRRVCIAKSAASGVSAPNFHPPFSAWSAAPRSPILFATMLKPSSLLVLCLGFFVCVATALTQGRGPAAPAAAATSADWPTFGGDNSRTNANMAPTRITAANVGSMVRQQVTISAPIDAGLIYLRGVQVNGASHDVFFGTTNLGHTIAIDANEAKVLWEFAPPEF